MKIANRIRIGVMLVAALHVVPSVTAEKIGPCDCLNCQNGTSFTVEIDAGGCTVWLAHSGQPDWGIPRQKNSTRPVEGYGLCVWPCNGATWGSLSGKTCGDICCDCAPCVE